jgi:glyoxalase family protein
VLRVASYDSLEYWMDRLIANQTHSEMLRLDPTQPQSLVFHDPEGHDVELMVSDSPNTPLVAEADDIPTEHRILGIEGPRSFTSLEETLPFAQHIGFRQDGDRLVLDVRGPGPLVLRAPAAAPVGRHARRRLAPHRLRRRQPRRAAGLPRLRDDRARPYTAIFDHHFFDSCYAMSPGGRVELCTSGSGFTLDERLEDLGDQLCLSPRVGPLRAKLEAELTPLVNPRPRSAARAGKPIATV